MCEYSGLIGYGSFELAKIEVEKTAKYNKFVWKKALKSKELREKGLSHDDTRITLDADIELALLKKNYEMETGKKTLVEALLNTYNQYYKVLSRELSKRGMYEHELDNKEYRGRGKRR